MQWHTRCVLLTIPAKIVLTFSVAKNSRCMRLSFKLSLCDHQNVYVFSLKASARSWCHSSKRQRSTLFCSATSPDRNLHFAASSNVFRLFLWWSLCYCMAWASRSTIHTHARCWPGLFFRASEMHSWSGVRLDTLSPVLPHLPVLRYIVHVLLTLSSIGRSFSL